MILLHRPRLIFMKPHKVAGTSLEVALSPFAGPDDIVTPLRPDEEETRRAMGCSGPRNHTYRWYELPFVPLSEWRVARQRKIGPFKFRGHISARELRDRIKPEMWRGFTKLAIVRNPFDQAVSTYFWSRRSEQQTFEQFWMRNPHLIGRNTIKYAIDGENVIDIYLRYERLDEDVAALEKRYPDLSGLAENFARLRVYSGHRPTNATARAMFDNAPALRKLFEQRCRFEIERFGYTL